MDTGGGGAPGWAMTPEQHQHHLMQQQQAQQRSGGPVPGVTATSVPSSVPGPSQQKVVTPPPSGNAAPRVWHKNNRLANMEDKVLITRTADEETEDGRIRNKEAMAKIRDAWVYKQVRQRVDEFTEYKQVSIRLTISNIRSSIYATDQPFIALGSHVSRDLECQCQRQR